MIYAGKVELLKSPALIFFYAALDGIDDDKDLQYRQSDI